MRKTMPRLTSDDALEITPALLTKAAGNIAGQCRARGAIVIVVQNDGSVVVGGTGLDVQQQAQAMRLAERSMPMGRIDRVKL